MIERSIESTTVETLGVRLTAEEDPTSDSVEFSLTANSATDPGTWTAGTWDASEPWDSNSGKCRAITPTIGSSSAQLEVTEGAYHKLWVRIDGLAVKLAATILGT